MQLPGHPVNIRRLYSASSRASARLWSFLRSRSTVGKSRRALATDTGLVESSPMERFKAAAVTSVRGTAMAPVRPGSMAMTIMSGSTWNRCNACVTPRTAPRHARSR